MSSKLTKLMMGAAVMALAPATQAFAGTQAGTSVSNTFTLEYTVNGTTETLDPPTPATFLVDRRVDLTVTPTGVTNTGTNGSPEAGDTVTHTFTVTNETNFPQSYNLDAITAGLPAGTTLTATVDGVAYVLDDGTAPPLTQDVAEDGTITVTISYVVPTGALNGQTYDVALVADTHEPSTGGLATNGTQNTATAGDEVTVPNTTQDNTIDGVQTILADNTGSTPNVTVPSSDDDDGQGDHSGESRATVAGESLSAVKSVALIKEGPLAAGDDCATLTGTAPITSMYFPGSCVEYNIEVQNTSAFTLTIDELQDILAEELIFSGATTSNITVASADFSTPAANTQCDGTSTGATSCVVEVVNGTIASSTTGNLVIRAIVK